MQPLKTLNRFNQTEIYECYWSVCKKKKLENLWFSKNASCDWIMFFQVPQIE